MTCQNAVNNALALPPSPLPRMYVPEIWQGLDRPAKPVFNTAEFFEIFGLSKKCPKIFLRLQIHTNMSERKHPLYSIDGTYYRCPLCQAEVYWACPGNTGYAHCANSSTATRTFKPGEFHKLKICNWKGLARRRQNGTVEIYYYP
jgi:hypothetical protein